MPFADDERYNERMSGKDDSMTPVGSGVKLTYEDFLQFPDDGKRHELIDGEHYVTPCPNTKHQRVSGNFYWLIRSYLEQHRIGQLFYIDGNNALTAVPVQTGGSTFSQGNPAKLFDARYYLGNTNRTFDVSIDGQRFLMFKDNATSEQTSNATPASLIVVEHWFEELKQRVPAK